MPRNRRFLGPAFSTIALLMGAGLAAAADGASTAHLIVHPENPGLAMPADFLGFSCEKKILSRQCFQADNAGLLALFKNLGNGVLRVGANEVDSTSWSLAETKPLASMQENKYSEKPSTIGPPSVDNLFAFARRSGWRVIYGLNLAANDPAMAADEAAYAMQVGGKMVLALEIGNEPNLYPKNAKREGKRSEKYGYPQYREEFGSYVNAIRAKLPEAPLTGPATTRICKWFPDFVNDFKSSTSLITSHLYTLSARGEAPDSPRFASIENLFSRNVEAEWLPQLEASKAAGIPFRLGECNTASGGGKHGVSDAFASALWAVEFLFEVAKHGGAGVNFHGGFSPGNYAPIVYLKKEERYEPSPLYYGMLFFHQAAQGRLVPLDCQTSAKLVVHALLGDDKKLRVVLINKDPAQSVEASIECGGRSKAEIIRLTSPSLAATEGIALAGNAVAKDGSWTPQPGEAVPCTNGKCKVAVPAGSAALVTFEAPER